jgi:hypothetical protein
MKNEDRIILENLYQKVLNKSNPLTESYDIDQVKVIQDIINRISSDESFITSNINDQQKSKIVHDTMNYLTPILFEAEDFKGALKIIIEKLTMVSQNYDVLKDIAERLIIIYKNQN